MQFAKTLRSYMTGQFPHLLSLWHTCNNRISRFFFFFCEISPISQRHSWIDVIDSHIELVMSLLVPGSWQGVEWPPHTQVLSVKPFTRLGFDVGWIPFRRCFNQGCGAKWDESSQEEDLNFFRGRWGQICDLNQKMIYPLVFHPLWLTADMSPVWHWQDFHITVVIRTRHHKTRPRTRAIFRKNTRNGGGGPPSSEECSHWKPVLRWLTPHPGTFMFNPWPLAHLALNSNMRALRFLLA